MLSLSDITKYQTHFPQMDTYIVEDNVSEYEANKKGGLSVGNGSGDEHAL